MVSVSRIDLCQCEVFARTSGNAYHRWQNKQTTVIVRDWFILDSMLKILLKKNALQSKADRLIERLIHQIHWAKTEQKRLRITIVLEAVNVISQIPPLCLTLCRDFVLFRKKSASCFSFLNSTTWLVGYGIVLLGVWIFTWPYPKINQL